MVGWLLFIGFAIAVVWLRGVFSGMSVGEVGEAYISGKLKRLPEEYHVIDNVVIEKNGYTNQIDHVVVSPYGLFCIETKNYQGIILGSENAQYWTQNIWGNEYKLYNPLLQNGKHVKALRRELKVFGELQIMPITVFTSRGKLRVKHGKDVSLIQDDELLHEIRAYKDVIYDDETVKKIADYIRISEDFVYTSESEHTKNVRKAVKSSYVSEDNMKCPRCGANLVERHGKYGRFIGCSNYPNCTYTSH